MNWLKNKLCDWFHAGGDIKRDCHGRINWQCRTCSRWAIPVNPQTERLITDNAAGAKDKTLKPLTYEQIAELNLSAVTTTDAVNDVRAIELAHGIGVKND
jgi:hypothetical protein